MQRYLVLFTLFLLSLPVGLSITGCQTNVGSYCNGLGYGIKTDAVSAIDLEPKTTGISLSWGQTSQLATPTATTCKGATATVGKYTYGSSNLLLADISPTGAVCGGTWNRNSPGGIADFTICTPPAGSSTENCTSTTTACGVAQLTASGSGVTSNIVNVYVHPPVTAITIPTPTTCASQNVTLASPLTAGTVVYGPNGVAIPDGNSSDPTTNYVGTVTYTPVDANIVSINNTSVAADQTGINGAATAKLPGSTVINATVSQVSSAAGYFYTCPPASIALNLNGSTTGGAIVQGSPQTLTSTILDTTGATINGLTMDFTSTQPQNIAVSTAGALSTTYPGVATVNAICQPGTCNEAPVSQVGVFGTGMPVSSNNLTITSSNKSSNYLWMASTQSQYFSEVDLTTGTPGSPVKLPYIPNSMVLDQLGTNLYFGSYRELMVYTAATNALVKEDTNVPGVVLAVSPDATTVVINDQLRQVIYLYTYSATAPTYTSIGGLATKAKFSPDGKNVYIVGPDDLYVHNAATGWSTYPLNSTEQACTLNNNTNVTSTTTGTFDPFCGADLTVTVPSVFSFFSGSPNVAHSYCPNNQASPIYYPAASIGAAANAEATHLTATADGNHIIGANMTTLSDVWLYTNADQTTTGVTNPYVPTSSQAPGLACPAVTVTPLSLTTALEQTPFSDITPTEINSVVSSPDSTVAFITYTATAGTGLLPAYQPSTTAGSLGTLTNVQLSGSAQSPLAGIFAPNGQLFFVSTSGDDLVHYITPSTLTDTQTINPGLVDSNGKAVPVQMMAVFPRSTT